MIFWWTLALNGLWILGLAILIAEFGYRDWLARATGETRRELLTSRSSTIWRLAGWFLASAGWGLAQTDRWWSRAIFLALSGWLGWQMLGESRDLSASR